ncbi:MAG: amino acid ABC transporter permease [Planctomycetota bacterium]
MRSRLESSGQRVRVMTVFASLVNAAPWQEWIRPLGNTLGLMAGAGFIALLGGVLTGLAVQRVGMRRSGALDAVWLANLVRSGLVMSIALPLILHAAAWEATAGKFGWLVQLSSGGNLPWVTWIHGVHGIAILGLATERGLASIPTSLQESISLQRRWRHRLSLSLTLAFPWIGVGLCLVLLLAATEMTVVNLHSVRTIADQFYLLHAASPSEASVVAVLGMPMLLASLMILVWRPIQKRSTVIDAAPWWTPRGSDLDLAVNPSRPWANGIAAGLSLFALAVCLGIPVAGLLIQAGHTVDVVEGERLTTWSWRSLVVSLSEAPATFQREYTWTFLLGTCTAVISLPIAWLLARWARWRPSAQGILDAIALILFAIPGPVVGLMVVRVFALPLPGLDVIATETIIPTCLAVGLRATVVAYGVMRASYAGISDEVIDSARMDGGVTWLIRAVEIPLLRWHLVLAAACAGMVAAGDVPAMLPVLPPGVVTVSTRLFSLLHSGARYQEASLAFWYLAALLVLFVVFRSSRKRHAEKTRLLD